MANSSNTARIGTYLSALLLASLLLFVTGTASAQLSLLASTADEGPCSSPPASPKFSIKSGTYSAPQTVRLTARARGAVIFYTTDGWTPTSNSNRYVGPISVDKTTTVQAIALVPNCSISKAAVATYEIPSGSQTGADAELLSVQSGSDGAFALRSDAQIPLVFASPVDSRTAQVGDSISLTLAENLKVGDTVLASKGTPATGKVIQVDHSGVGDMPGEIQFQVDSLNVNGTKIPIHAVDALAGPYTAKASTIAIGAMSTGGLSLLFVHGKDARIPAGASLTATMAAGTILPNGVIAARATAENNVLVAAGPGTR